ncbi:uncharacterized protein LOC143551900 [Bidens hawaiensis]|uniref:uncharacterized protein LOC143551900 n=1 Tax=Bidens hawaiensis TaxID=980011 RepID=UPI00404B8B8D
MEQKLPVVAKKVWSLMRVVLLMLRKGIPKRRLLLEFNMMIKRGKIVRKALQNLMFHHHHNPPPGEYEFSCSNTPSNNNHPFAIFSSNKKQHVEDHVDVMAINAAVMKAMEMMIHSETASPVLPGFGRSPMVRQLRVTDSPFPVGGVDEDCHVDEAAEQFISRFYNDLRRQNTKGGIGSGGMCV